MLGTPRHTPYDKGRFQLSLGIRELDPADWLEVDDRYPEHLAEKRRLLAERPDEVFDGLPDSLPAQRECLDRLLEHLARHHAGLVEADDATVRVVRTGDAYDRAAFAERPLDLAGRLVQEDLCLMAPAGDTWRLAAASLCFASRWRLADKLGRPMAAIHQPVPGFNDKLARPVDRFFARVAPGRVYARLNWSVIDDPALFQPTGHGRTAVNPAITVDNAGAMVWLRVERQTFVSLPRSGALVFGIKTVVDPLSAIVGRPLLAAALRATLDGMPDEMRRYKSMAPFWEALGGWLDRAAGAGAA